MPLLLSSKKQRGKHQKVKTVCCIECDSKEEAKEKKEKETTKRTSPTGQWSRTLFLDMCYATLHLASILGLRGQVSGLNSRKSVRWSAVLVPCLSRLWLKLRGSRAAAPKGSMTYAFTHMGDFLLLLFLLLRPSPLKSQSRGPNSSLEAQIPVLRPKSQPQGPNPSLKA